MKNLPHTHAQTFAAHLLQAAQGIRAVFFDVDGILTRGELLYTEAGETIKQFHTLDGHGLKLLQQAGIMPCIITGRDSAALRARLAALGITHAAYSISDKAAAAASMLHTLGLDWQHSAAMGDDWPDLPLFTRCAFAASVPNAHAEVQARADYVTQAAGGTGAVREICDLLLHANGSYAALLQSYLAPHAATTCASNAASAPHAQGSSA